MITVTGNFDEVINSVKSRKKRLESKFDEYLERLGKEGIDIAKTKMGTIQYDGTVDLFTYYEREGNRIYVAVHGESVTFIEFGTGVHYSAQHPKAHGLGMIRGTFGQGRGANPPWYFKEENGQVGFGEVVRTNKDGSVIVRTLGNPPNRIVYDTAKELREKAVAIAREVYSDD